MPKVLIVGGGLAGLAGAAALGSSGFEVELLEARPFLGGRATSWPIPSAGDSSPLIDNCQHVLLRCCVNLLDLYRRLGVEREITFYREFFFVEPGGRVSVMKRGVMPPPLHFTGSFLGMRCFSAAEKLAIARAMLSIRTERLREDLDRITMLEWLREHRQPPRAISRFWNQVLVSAVNEELDRMAAAHGLQVFWLGMLARANSYEMGVPDVPLRELYRDDAWRTIGAVTMHKRQAVDRFEVNGESVSGAFAGNRRFDADYYICALPFERIPQIMPEGVADISDFTHSPITGIHLWFDRPVTDLPHATLLDRTIQWMFNKSEGRYLQVVVSASRSLVEKSRPSIIELATAELAEFFPQVSHAKVERAEVIKEVRATFAAAPGLESRRPASETKLSNLFLAGDWTRTGWPATMEGAVRSGYLAAEAVTRAAGAPQTFLLPDVG